MNRESALTAAILAVLGIAAVAWQTYGLPDLWLADEIMWIVEDMVARRSFNPRHFMYPSFMADVCYVLARVLGVESGVALAHLCRTVSAGFFLTGVICAGRAVEVVLGKRLPFAYFFMGTLGAFLHHAHIATVNSCFFFTILLALLQFMRTIASRRESDFYLSVLACSLAVGAKYNGCFLLGALPVLWLVAFDEPLRPKRFARPLLISLLIAPLPFLVTTPFSLLDAGTFHKEWMLLTKVEGPAFKTAGGGALDYLKHFGGFSLGFFSPVGLVLLGGWGLTVYGSWLRRWRAVRSERPIVFRASLVLGWTLVLYLVMNWQIGILQSRYYLPASLLLGVLFLIALHAAEAPRLRAGTIALLVVFNTANAWAHVAAYRFSAKARTARELVLLEGRIGVIALPQRRPFQPGVLDERCDVFVVDLGDRDATSFEEYIDVVARFFSEKKPRWVVFEEIVATWPIFRPRKDAGDYGARLRYLNPGLAVWEEHLGRAGYRRVRVIENCEGSLAMRWLLGSYYLATAEGVGRPVYIYERRAQ